MFHKIKLWWYTSILKKVVYKPDGKPYDCHGLRYEGRLPFGKETRYSITNEYIGCIYKGNGCYYYEDGLLLDHKNPYRMKIFMDIVNKFKG